YSLRPEEGVRSCGTVDSCETPDVGIRNRTWGPLEDQSCGKNWDKVEQKRRDSKQTQLKTKVSNYLVVLTNQKTVLKGISDFWMLGASAEDKKGVGIQIQGGHGIAGLLLPLFSVLD
ncbi:hypothetical protein STEG23_008692, partial [Scotinomys teguina]